MPASDKSLIGTFIGHSAGILAVTWLVTLMVLEGLIPFPNVEVFWLLPAVGLIAWIALIVRFAGRVDRKRSVAIGVAVSVPVGAVTLVAVTAFALFTGLFTLSMAHGRPLHRRRSRVRVRWRFVRAGAAPQIPWLSRVRLAAAWLGDARREQESVTAFEVLADRLAAVGAPADLVRDARRFATQELGHAHDCAALASRHAGVEIRVDAASAEPVEIRTDELAALAAESLVDGCLGEGHAAVAARIAAGDTTDASTHAVLERIADEEAEHAAHGWRLLEHCVRAGGSAVRDRIAVEIDRLAHARPVTLLRRGAATRVLVAYGRAAEARPGATFLATRDDVLGRARRMIGSAAS